MQLRELREELRGTVQRGDDRFKQLSLEKAELEAANMIMKEQLDDLRASRERETSQRDKEMRSLRETANVSSEQMRQVKEEMEERMQEVTRAKMQAESEFDKERALFDQKVQYLERSLKEKQDRERNYLSELHSMRSDMTLELRGQCQKYETEVKQLQIDLDEERERVGELENLLIQRETELESAESLLAQQDASYRQML